MKLICKHEARKDNGEKLMQFTEGVIYEFTETEADAWEVEDDNGEIEKFWNLDIMFKPLT